MLVDKEKDVFLSVAFKDKEKREEGSIDFISLLIRNEYMVEAIN